MDLAYAVVHDEPPQVFAAENVGVLQWVIALKVVARTPASSLEPVVVERLRGGSTRRVAGAKLSNSGWKRPDCETAAALYRRCRRQGETVRKLIDCLIAAVAIRVDVPVVQADGDFDALARYASTRPDRDPAVKDAAVPSNRRR